MATLEEKVSRFEEAERMEQPVNLDDFRAYMPNHQYIFVPTRDLWPASSVDARIQWPEDHDGKRIKPSRWLDAHAAVEQMTWAPGLPMLIVDQLIETCHTLVAEGHAVLLVEQNLAVATEVADRQLIMVSGRIEAEMLSGALMNDPDAQRRYLGVDSLSYLSLDRLISATGTAGAGFCTACLTGEYPIEIPVNLSKAVVGDGADEAVPGTPSGLAELF